MKAKLLSGHSHPAVRDTVYYKHGCFDPDFNELAALQWLLSKVIAAAKSNGAIEFDMGRTEEGNAGLLNFKNHLVSQPQRLHYWKFPETSSSAEDGWKLRMAKHALPYMPDRLLTLSEI